jgi:uncharacterized membrane protein YphA (DoxX/SURF4 family)
LLSSIHLHIAAALIARVFLGLLFFFQGFDAVFRVKVRGVVQLFEEGLSSRGVSSIFIRLGAYFTSYTELVGGLLLIVGFVKYYALYILGIDLLVVAVAFGILKPMWDLSHVFPRLVLVLFLLLIPSQWDVISADYCWSLIKFIHHFN